MARRTARAPGWPSAMSWSMRVFRTVTIENSAATKNPLVHTRASSPASRHATLDGVMLVISRFRELGFSVRKEMRVDELVDDRLIGGVDFFELHAHSDAAIGPRDAALGVDVAFAARHAEA